MVATDWNFWRFAAEIRLIVAATGVCPPWVDAVWSLMSVAAAAVAPVPVALYFRWLNRLLRAFVADQKASFARARTPTLVTRPEPRSRSSMTWPRRLRWTA